MIAPSTRHCCIDKHLHVLDTFPCPLGIEESKTSSKGAIKGQKPLKFSKNYESLNYIIISSHIFSTSASHPFQRLLKMVCQAFAIIL